MEASGGALKEIPKLDFGVEKSLTGGMATKVSSSASNVSTPAADPSQILITFGLRQEVFKPPKVCETVECF